MPQRTPRPKPQATDVRLLGRCDLRAAAPGAPRRFDILAYSGGKLRVDKIPLPVIVDLSAMPADVVVPVLIDHKNTVETTLGQTDAITTDGRTLTIAGPITGVSSTVQQVLAQADAGHVWQASIRCTLDDVDEIAAGETVHVNGQTFTGPCYVARAYTFRETSVLPMGADPTTSVNLAAAAASLHGALAMTFEDWLKSYGIDPAQLTDAGKAALTKQFEAETAAANPAMTPAAGAATATAPPPTQVAAGASTGLDLQASAATSTNHALESFRKATAADLRRQDEIRAKCQGHDMIAAKAIEEGWSSEKAELEVLKAQRATATAGAPAGRGKARILTGEILEAALCLTAGLPDPEKHFKADLLQQADENYRGFGLQQMLLMAAHANGYSVGPGDKIHRGNWKAVAQAAFADLQAGPFSTVSLPGIFSNVANKEILSGYQEEDQTWKEVAQIKSVQDFKTVTSYRLLDSFEYEELGPAGEIAHGSVSEESYTRKVKTYAKMFALTREDMINDDLSAFDHLREVLGRGSAQRFNKIFWKSWLANSQFFTTARGNYITGATTNLGLDGVGLELAVTAFRKLRSPVKDGSKRIGNTLGGRPALLLVPPELEFIADRLYVSANVNTGGAATATSVPDTNIHANKYKPVVSDWLSDSEYNGSSSTAWYLLRAPQNGAGRVVSFLNGVQKPTVESADLDFNVLGGVQFRGYHDWGVDEAEPLCGVKSKGTT